MLKSLKKLFNKRTDYNKLKKEIAPVPPKFINALMDSLNLGLIDKTQSLLSDLSSGEIANIIEQLEKGKLPYRQFGKPIHIPSGKEKVSQIPKEWKQKKLI